jgi:hypothetical protein
LYDRPPPRLRRRSKDVLRRSWLASRLRSRRPQPGRQPPRRRPTVSRWRPHRLLSRCQPRHQRRLQPRLPRRPQRSHQRRLRPPYLLHRMRQPLGQLNSQRPHSRRRFPVQGCRAPQASLQHPPLGPATAQLSRRGHVLALLEDFLVRRVRQPAVLALPALATTPSPPRREWASRARHGQAQMVADLPHLGRLLVAVRCRALILDCPGCHDPIRR